MFRILIVDDDKNIRYLLSEVLQMEKYGVLTADNGETALSVIDKEHVDLVVVDITMPKMDGYEFTRTVRETRADLPILMISAKQLPEDRKKGFTAGIDDYMSKPLDMEEFVLHVKALLRRAGAETDRKLSIGDVTLDYDSLSVTRGEETILLPQKEFLLLYKLLSFPDKIFTRIQLMDEIWGMDCETGWETVTVHIGRLRKRFEGWQEFELQSIRGLGYKAVKRV